jgi:uncharacterized YigZ family protein
VKTLARPATVESEIRHSRFVAHARRVDNMESTLAFFEAVADPAATHNCWAWRLGQRYRFSDDGEPASSAGKPILAAIEGKNLDHAMVVVTRYFGGVKLGVGGLVRAYAGSAARCIDQAGIVEIEPRVRCAIEADFGWTGQIYAALEACEGNKLKETFGRQGIRLEADLTESGYKRLRLLLRDATRGQAAVRVLA